MHEVLFKSIACKYRKKPSKAARYDTHGNGRFVYDLPGGGSRSGRVWESGSDQ